MYKFDAKETKDKIVQWIKDFFEENGKNHIAVIGMSGGKDSSIVAALCVEALGKDRVFGVLMPQGRQLDIGYAREICNYLDINCTIIPIGVAVNVLEYEIDTSMCMEATAQCKSNLPARIRMATLYDVAYRVNGRVANTCNLSETLLGWETRWGDAVGDFAPIKDLTVEEVKAVGYELGIPKKFIEKIPTDGLCSSDDEDALGFKYSVMDRYTRTGEIHDEKVKNKIDERVKNSRFKRKEIPYFNSDLKRYVD